MGTASWVILIVAAVGAVFFLQRHQSGRPSQSAQRQSAAAAKSTATSARQSAGVANGAALNPYRATSIRPGANACAAVTALAGKRFLVASEEIPPLPLPDCDVAACKCIYVKLRDRRDGNGDRRALRGQNLDFDQKSAATEKRGVKRGRRSSDLL